MQNKSGVQRIQILGVPVDSITQESLHLKIETIINNLSKALILNVNVHCINLAFENSWLRSFLNSADIVFCDGAGVVLGANLLGKQIPERITYADWVWKLAELSDEKKFTLYFLGASPGVSEKAADRLLERFPNLQVVGTHDGFFDKSIGSKENEKVIDEINKLKPNFLILGMGMPIQERWLMENWDCIDANIALTGGAVFDYVSGELPRAPTWMTNNGMEWLGRLLIEPRRLWRRYLIGIPQFFWRILLQRFGILKI